MLNSSYPVLHTTKSYLHYPPKNKSKIFELSILLTILSIGSHDKFTSKVIKKSVSVLAAMASILSIYTLQCLWLTWGKLWPSISDNTVCRTAPSKSGLDLRLKKKTSQQLIQSLPQGVCSQPNTEKTFWEVERYV